MVNLYDSYRCCLFCCSSNNYRIRFHYQLRENQYKLPSTAVNLSNNQHRTQMKNKMSNLMPTRQSSADTYTLQFFTEQYVL